MLSYLYGPAMQRLQPLVFLGEEVDVKSRQEVGAVTLVTALGIAHPLRCLGSVGTLVEHHQRLNRPPLQQLLRAECARRNANNCTDPLGYFLTYLAPVFLERDWHEEYQLTAPSVNAVIPRDMSAEVAEVANHCPVPQVPSPALLVLGRVWLLAETSAVSDRVHVRCNGITLSLTGEYVVIGALERVWCEQVQQFVTEAVAQVIQQGNPLSNAVALSRAQAELGHSGYLQYGDLLFIAGTPARLGHVIPPHYNRTFGRQSEGDLAMAAPLTLPPSIGGLEVHGRNAAGRWVPVGLPHSLCLGPKPTGEMPEAPGLALAAYLRWAALRVMSNGRFHEHDT